MNKGILTLIVIAFITSVYGEVMCSSLYLIKGNNFNIQPWPGSIVKDVDNNITCLLTETFTDNQTLSSNTGGGDGSYPANTISIAEFNPDKTCSSDASPAFISVFQSDKEIIFIPMGCYLITNSLTIPPEKTLVFERGAILDVTGELSGNNTGIHAGLNKIFTHTSNITGTWRPDNGEAYPEWFGVKGDGTGTHDMAAFQKALEVFCEPQYYGADYDWTDNIRGRATSFGTTVRASGACYIVEKTLEFPKGGNLVLNTETLMLGDTNDFFDSYVNIKLKPYNITGGRWEVIPYAEQHGYKSSAKDSAAKIQYAYNKNPVFNFSFLNDRNAIPFDDNLRYKSGLNDITIKYKSKGYVHDINPLWRYDGVKIMPDTMNMSSGELTLGVRYVFVSVGSGDDFTNCNAPANPSVGETFACKHETIPDDWTHGTVIRPVGGAAYFDQWNNIYIYQADTGIYIQGDKDPLTNTHAYLNGWMFDNVMLDMCNTALVIGDRAYGNMFTGLLIQIDDDTDFPNLIIHSYGNQLSGLWWDVSATGKENIKITNVNNNIDMIPVPYIEYRDIVHGMAKPLNFNNFGKTPLWTRDASTSFRSYWFNGDRMGIGQMNNYIYVDTDSVPAASLDVRATVSTATALMVESNYQSGNYTTSIGSLNQFDPVIKFSTRAMYGDGKIKGAKGLSIGFYGTHRYDSIATGNQFQFGRIGFRQTSGRATVNSQSDIGGVFQIWQNSGGVIKNTVTIDSTGKMGLLGTSDPQYTIDLSDTGTLRSSNIEDNGTDVKIKGRTNLNILHLTPTSRPTNATLGDMYLSGEDGSLYLYTSSGWKAVVLK